MSERRIVVLRGDAERRGLEFTARSCVLFSSILLILWCRR